MHISLASSMALVPFLHFGLVIGVSLKCGRCPADKAGFTLNPTGTETKYSCRVLSGYADCSIDIPCIQFHCEECGWAALRATWGCTAKHATPHLYYYIPGVH
ncbi:hypothetical protein PGT21_012979 [Puccinia graminis f. sp. tritici]|uniref:Secreted protein n=1 Tax=Puccinia graminis f. sp. tritici TaxID=56615 RepID=A0A5B0LML1_PUCGR|nr:hypothetical protein PGT21_013886 [Puccinia graminis f. sp. tritici]KAA1068230.1 hypothetical protein PGTUg99_028259 [Puccinia graminis f. sp. tritici]KAA1085621.1 hypothetical protein PGT21_012979 [Puccinia graminis f. sp. tritici]KAA1136033.1 hypothetical protein PGTUg99_022955 [Puccinia graminis f. sp. tritici]